VRAAINAPESTRIVVIIAVGKPGKMELLDERSREKEASPRERKPLGAIAFADRWGQPLPFLHED
jgi:hypothetical protein